MKDLTILVFAPPTSTFFCTWGRQIPPGFGGKEGGAFTLMRNQLGDNYSCWKIPRKIWCFLAGKKLVLAVNFCITVLEHDSLACT